MQIDYRTVPAADDVDVRGAMIVEVDRGAQAIKAEHRRHGLIPSRNPSGWL
jgi:hypothetical protein